MSPPGAGQQQDPADQGQDRRLDRRPDRQQGPRERTTGRADLARNPRFAEISPEVGVLDEDSFDASLSADADGTLSLLTEMTHATDERLRAAARRLAARIVLDLARRGTPQRRGVGQLRASTADRGGDLDVEASLETVLEGKAARRAPRAEELVARDWSRPELALCLLVDRSGSMGGERLAAAALTAAACAYRAPGDFAVVAFAREVDVLRPMGSPEPAASAVEKVLQLRGHGTTGIAGALRAATEQLGRTRAARRVVVLLSDCRQTDEIDPRPLARRLPELVVLAPVDDAEQAEAFARESGARFAPLSGAADAPAALAQVLGA